MIDENTPIWAIIPLLRHSQAILITRKGEVIGIATRADIMEFFRKVKGY